MAALSFHDAQLKARFGHRDWIGYRDRDGAYQTAQRSPASIKAALLAIGTRGRFTILSASTGVPYSYGWRCGLRMIRNATVGC